MTEVASLHVASHAELIFIIVISNQFKTGVKSTLTSQIKELGAIYTFGIKNWLTWINPERKWDKRCFVGDADELLDEVVGSGQRTETNLFSQELDKWEKPF